MILLQITVPFEIIANYGRYYKLRRYHKLHRRNRVLNTPYQMYLYLEYQGNSCLPITARCRFSIPSENIRKPKGFLIFSEGIEKQHRAVMG